jgi:hypothetical protein
MSVLATAAQGLGYLMNPFAIPVDAARYLSNEDNRSGLGSGFSGLGQNRAKQIGSQIGSSANFDAMAELTPAQRRIMSNFDERQTEQFQTAISDSVTNSVRLGQMTPDEARARVERANFTLNPTELNNSGQLQMGAMSAVDLPDATSQLGDYSGLGLDDEYWSQLKNAAALQENITQDVGDAQVSREFDRTAQYRLPIENYRMNRDFAYGQKAEQNTMKRNQASGLLNSYANTAQALMTSGL